MFHFGLGFVYGMEGPHVLMRLFIYHEEWIKDRKKAKKQINTDLIYTEYRRLLHFEKAKRTNFIFYGRMVASSNSGGFVMNESAYEVAASIMRYFFVLLIAFVMIGTVIRSVAEGRRIKNVKRLAGLSVRWIEILAPDDYKGKMFPVRDDTYIGSAKECEVSLPKTELKDEHARIYYHRGEVMLQTRQRRFCEVNGAKPTRNTILSDGDIVWMRDVCFACRKRKAETEVAAYEQD